MPLPEVPTNPKRALPEFLRGLFFNRARLAALRETRDSYGGIAHLIQSRPSTILALAKVSDRAGLLRIGEEFARVSEFARAEMPSAEEAAQASFDLAMNDYRIGLVLRLPQTRPVDTRGTTDFALDRIISATYWLGGVYGERIAEADHATITYPGHFGVWVERAAQVRERHQENIADTLGALDAIERIIDRATFNDIQAGDLFRVVEAGQRAESRLRAISDGGLKVIFRPQDIGQANPLGTLLVNETQTVVALARQLAPLELAPAGVAPTRPRERLASLLRRTQLVAPRSLVP